MKLFGHQSRVEDNISLELVNSDGLVIEIGE